MAKENSTYAAQAQQKPPEVTEMKGRGIFYDDDSFEFTPRIPNGYPLYTVEVSRTNARYIKQYLEPESILQNEFYALCALIRKSKEKGEANKKCNATKQKNVCQK